MPDKKCPRCEETIGEFPALSRLDNRTEICSQCGLSEAIFNLVSPGRELPPFGRNV